MKLVSYNILNGGLGRLDPIYETLLYLDADVVGLCEADDPKGVRYLAEKLRMDFVSMEGSNGRAVALLSREPIQRAVNLAAIHPELERGAMEAVVEVGGTELRLAIAHLEAGQYPENEERRLVQLDTLLRALGHDTTLLMGDFNAAAAYHPFDFAAASPKVRRRLEERGRRELDHRVVDRLLAAGWIDALHRARPREPRHTYTTGFPCSRFDYLWLGGELPGRLEDAGVEQGGFAPYCSDHFPIWARLRW